MAVLDIQYELTFYTKQQYNLLQKLGNDDPHAPITLVSKLVVINRKFIEIR